MRGEIARFLSRIGALIAIWIGILIGGGADGAENRPWLLAACALFFSFYFLSSSLSFPGAGCS